MVTSGLWRSLLSCNYYNIFIRFKSKLDTQIWCIITGTTTSPLVGHVSLWERLRIYVVTFWQWSKTSTIETSCWLQSFLKTDIGIIHFIMQILSQKLRVTCNVMLVSNLFLNRVYQSQYFLNGDLVLNSKFKTSLKSLLFLVNSKW